VLQIYHNISGASTVNGTVVQSKDCGTIKYTTGVGLQMQFLYALGADSDL